MEIGPITGVRAVALLDRVKPDRCAAANLAIEPSTRADDEADTPGSLLPDRGLEDEEATPEDREDAGSEPEDSQPATTSRVDLFA